MPRHICLPVKQELYKDLDHLKQHRQSRHRMPFDVYGSEQPALVIGKYYISYPDGIVSDWNICRASIFQYLSTLTRSVNGYSEEIMRIQALTARPASTV